jgi:L-ribulose-5-phosphate 3-epimerase
MQGRLSPLVHDRVQAFPWSCWQEEFPIAERSGFRLMEWTLDQGRLYENPLLTLDGRAEIRALCQHHGLTIPSVTGDCFMQAPFWKAQGVEQETLQQDFRAVAEACAALDMSIIVVPVVDDGRLENAEQESALVSYLQSQTRFFAEHRLRVAFESDLSPQELARFIRRFDLALFGINYDIGNSAASGFRPVEEIAAYGDRIINVHVKDRPLDGTTVPLSTGNADFESVFAALAGVGYTGNLILQTARSAEGDHLGVLCRYRDMTANWLSHHAA